MHRQLDAEQGYHRAAAEHAEGGASRPGDLLGGEGRAPVGAGRVLRDQGIEASNPQRGGDAADGRQQAQGGERAVEPRQRGEHATQDDPRRHHERSSRQPHDRDRGRDRAGEGPQAVAGHPRGHQLPGPSGLGAEDGKAEGEGEPPEPADAGHDDPVRHDRVGTQDIASAAGAPRRCDLPVSGAPDGQEQRRGERYGEGVREHQRHGAVLGHHPGGDGRTGDHAAAMSEVLPGQRTHRDSRPDAVPEVGEEGTGSRAADCSGRPDQESTDAQMDDGQDAQHRSDGDDEVTQGLDREYDREGATRCQPVPQAGCPPRRREERNAC